MTNISVAKFFLYFLRNRLSLDNVEADSFPEDDVHGGRVGEPDHHLDDHVGPLIVLGDPVQVDRVVDGGVPAGHHADAVLQVADD